MTCKYVVAQGRPTENNCEDCGLGPCLGNQAIEHRVLFEGLKIEELEAIISLRMDAFITEMKTYYDPPPKRAKRLQNLFASLTRSVDALTDRMEEL